MKPGLLSLLAQLALVVVFCVTPAVMFTQCTPAQSAEVSQIEQTVLTELTSGVALAAVETAIDQLLPAGKDIDAIINDAISVLRDLGLLPPNLFTAAQAMQAQIAGEIAHRVSSGKR